MLYKHVFAVRRMFHECVLDRIYAVSICLKSIGIDTIIDTHESERGSTENGVGHVWYASVLMHDTC